MNKIIDGSNVIITHPESLAKYAESKRMIKLGGCWIINGYLPKFYSLFDIAQMFIKEYYHNNRSL